ncbi:Uncharacterised protein [Klebsiella quasivariicola]|nr:Uncharacterised protein [Klebsiella quasivariicola]
MERYQNSFVDKTPDHTENRLWILRVKVKSWKMLKCLESQLTRSTI